MDKNGTDFDAVYDEFYTRISRYLKQLVGEREAEDLTQEVFIKVNKGLSDFKGQSKLSTWIYRVATNTALDRMRSSSFQRDRQRIRLENPGDASEGKGEDVCVDEKGLSAEREAIRKEMTECIRSFVGRLPENYRTVLALSELKDLKNHEIAEILGVSLDTVKIRLHRARVRLKEEFEGGCSFYHDEDGQLACDRKGRNPDKKQE
ncbi:MAG: sigma-70 family RNA polymerase sigma factor [Phycisphaerales bacterium]|nr:MAG: sigma-70 family RNA polymerase sigma factor [Phycisphaerales bacterium]